MAGKNNNKQFKCFLCPAKGFMKDDGSKCEKCPARFHPACAKRANKQSDGSYLSCCGKSDSQPNLNNTLPNLSNDNNINNDEFKQFAPLWAVLKPYLDS